MSRFVRDRLENIAASPGPGWRSQGANIGTGAVVKRDPAEAAKEWLSALGRAPSLKEKPAWEKHGEREGLSPDEIEQGWASLSKPAARDESNALATLRKVFGEAEGLDGGWVPLRDLLQPDLSGRVRRGLIPGLKTEATGFVGFPKMHQAPQAGNARGQAQLANEDPSGFPFSTTAAELVWVAAKELIRTHPLADPPEILRLAIEAAQVNASELTPEDAQLLQMAVQQLQNGPPQSNVRTSGVPGRRGVV